MTGPEPGARARVTCDALDDDGAGCATIDDATTSVSTRVHVAGAIAGEIVDVEIEHASPHVTNGQRHAWARCLGVVSPSPDRVAPACPAYGACGGCVMQHLAYPAQLAWKRDKVERVLARALGSDMPVAPAPCEPSPRTLGYRNQSKLVVARAKDGRALLGAFGPRSHDVVDMRGCRVVEPPLDDVARTLADLVNEHGVRPFDERTRTGDLRYAVLRANARGDALVTLVSATAMPRELPAVANALRARMPHVTGVVANHNATAGNAIFGTDERVLAGTDHLIDDTSEGPVRLSSRSFFQLNRHVAARAYSLIAARVERLGGVHRAVDAYGGAGGVAFALAPFANEVVGIESNAAATDDATSTARARGLSGLRFIAADAAVGLAGIDTADVVVVNPPRAGCSSTAITEIQRLRPRLVAYLSCNPETLARDLSRFTRDGFVIESVRPLDMLPHTHHVECLVFLVT